MYAVGRIPGSFNRREGKPSDRGVLISRLIDRPMRPLFDEELRNDVVLTNTILAQDYDNPVEIVASIGSSLVIAYSDIPGTARLRPPMSAIWTASISSTPRRTSATPASAS